MRSSTRTCANEESRLVRWLVFSICLFLIFFVAFARAVVLVAGENIPDNLLDQQPLNTTTGTLTSSAPNVETDSVKASRARATALLDEYYVIFVGREVGYTLRSTLMSSLVQGIPNNLSKKFKTLDEALSAYSEAARRGNVRRVRSVIGPSGHMEFVFECVGVTAGMRNLDEPHSSPLPLTFGNTPPTPCNSEGSIEPSDVSTEESSMSSATSAPNPTGLVSPTGWSVINSHEVQNDAAIVPTSTTAREQTNLLLCPSADTTTTETTVSKPPCKHSHTPSTTNADTVVISRVMTSASPPHEPSSVPATQTVVILDSDEDSSNSSILANNSVSTHSAHSSDIYYADKGYDIAFATYIEEEEAEKRKATDARSAGGLVE